MKEMNGTFKIIMQNRKYFLVLKNKQHPMPMLEITKKRYQIIKAFWDAFTEKKK